MDRLVIDRLLDLLVGYRVVRGPFGPWRVPNDAQLAMEDGICIGWSRTGSRGDRVLGRLKHLVRSFRARIGMTKIDVPAP